MSCENNAYTMKGLVYTSDGTDYADLVKEELGIQENGETLARLDADKAEQYKQQAVEELTAAGVTFPIGIDYYISASNQTALDSANVFKQCFIDSFGEDHVQLNIKTYVSSATPEVRTLHGCTPSPSPAGALTTVTRRTIWARKPPATTTLTSQPATTTSMK